MRQIYVGFSSPSKFKIGAQLIKWWINADYSHAYIKLDNKSLSIFTIYQASNGMVHFKILENFLKENIIIKEYSIPVDDEQYKNILRKCFSLSGEKYDYLDLIKILISDLFNKIGIKMNISNGLGYVCSELVGKICIENLKITFNKPTHLLNPKDIENELKNRSFICGGD